MEELTLFFEQIESLPCTIKEGEGVKELLDRVTDFQKEAAVLLSQEMPESRLLDKCIESGVVLDIELPEIPKLKQVIYISSVFFVCYDIGWNAILYLGSVWKCVHLLVPGNFTPLKKETLLPTE